MGTRKRSAREATAKDRPPGVADRLAEFRSSVDRVLREIRARPDLARRIVTRELGCEPREGTLRAIVHIAVDTATAGPRYELPRRLLAVHVLVDHEVSDLLDSPQLAPDRLRQSAQALAGLRRAARKLEGELLAALALAEGDDRALLAEIADALALSEDRVIAATVLAPRLELLIEESRRGDARAAVPTLTVEEAEMLARACKAVDDGLPGGRASINAVALRTLLEEDLGQLAALDGPRQSRRAVLDRLRREVLACPVVDRRLREQQDAAIAAGLEVFAAEIGRVKSALFTAQLRTRPPGSLRRAASRRGTRRG